MELLLIFYPILCSLIVFLLYNNQIYIKPIVRLTLIIEIVLSLLILTLKLPSNFQLNWLPSIGIQFAVGLDNLNIYFVLLTSICSYLIFELTFQKQTKKLAQFWGLYLLIIGALMGVFIAKDVVLFYFFWELVLIPIYFLCSIWGGEKRIASTIKFFIYTFIGSIFMLVGILYTAAHTIDGGFSYQSFIHNTLTFKQQATAFALMFIAFVIKIPLFPFHTWQPETYQQAPTTITMFLSALLAKMGLFGIIVWLKPAFPVAFRAHSNFVVILSVIGALYASLIAINQTNLKKLIAYSSIAHLALMNAAIFANNTIGLEGAILQLFNHGINVIGMWAFVYVLETYFEVTELNKMSGLAKKYPTFSILTIIIILANIAFPLTNAFIGEFLIFNGIFQFNKWIAAAAIISIILTALYSLNAVQKILLGESTNEHTPAIPSKILYIMAIIGAFIFVTGVYPTLLTHLFQNYIQNNFQY